MACFLSAQAVWGLPHSRRVLSGLGLPHSLGTEARATPQEFLAWPDQGLPTQGPN